MTTDQPPSRELIIISGADSGYFPLLRDTVLSVRALDAAVAIGILDLGLRPEERQWLAAARTSIVQPEWDVAFPHRSRMPNSFKAQVARPFLPRHFPGYDTYLWIDADAWLQDWRAVELYRMAAGRDRVAISIEIDRAYKRHFKRPKLLGRTLPWKCYREAFGWRVADRLGRNPFVNVGVFALHRDAPHWDAWARLITQVLQRTQFFYVEQIALNHAIFGDGLPANFLPAYCNWMVGDAAPAFDRARGLLVEPYAPHETIGVVHLAGSDAKDKVFRLDCLADGRLGGGVVETPLRFSDMRSLVG
ncbi:MAG TPA: glycosyl transferase [Stellaceae bacterium]|nr:glycosyl transferase [Stellaceae bacterium]